MKRKHPETLFLRVIRLNHHVRGSKVQERPGLFHYTRKLHKEISTENLPCKEF